MQSTTTYGGAGAAPITHPTSGARNINARDGEIHPGEIAVGVVIGNTVEAVNGMSGVDDTITIPTVMIKLSDRNLVANKLAAGETVNVSMRDVTGEAKSESYRWLMGEELITHLGNEYYD